MKKDDFLAIGDGQHWRGGLEPWESTGSWDGLSWGTLLSWPSYRPSTELGLQHPWALFAIPERMWGQEPPFLSQNMGKGFTRSGGELLPQDILGTRFSSRHRQLYPPRDHPDVLRIRIYGITCSFVYLYANTLSTP